MTIEYALMNGEYSLPETKENLKWLGRKNIARLIELYDTGYFNPTDDGEALKVMKEVIEFAEDKPYLPSLRPKDHMKSGDKTVVFLADYEVPNCLSQYYRKLITGRVTNDASSGELNDYQVMFEGDVQFSNAKIMQGERGSYADFDIRSFNIFTSSEIEYLKKNPLFMKEESNPWLRLFRLESPDPAYFDPIFKETMRG